MNENKALAIVIFAAVGLAVIYLATSGAINTLQ